MLRLSGLFLVGLTLAACDSATQDQIARNAAKSTVNRVVLERYPGVPVEPAINCIIDNATAQQIYALAADSVTGPTAATVEIVAGIVKQPDTVRCLAAMTLTGMSG